MLPGDGNGRVSRLLASLPLIRACYPFVNIRLKMRVEYLQALNPASYIVKSDSKFS